jgi:hypothetical protein
MFFQPYRVTEIWTLCLRMHFPYPTSSAQVISHLLVASFYMRAFLFHCYLRSFCSPGLLLSMESSPLSSPVPCRSESPAQVSRVWWRLPRVKSSLGTCRSSWASAFTCLVSSSQPFLLCSLNSVSYKAYGWVRVPFACSILFSTLLFQPGGGSGINLPYLLEQSPSQSILMADWRVKGAEHVCMLCGCGLWGNRWKSKGFKHFG